jgi:hypothetical protein
MNLGSLNIAHKSISISVTEQSCSCGSASALYSRGVWFKSQQGHWLSQLSILQFSSLVTCRQMLGYYLELGHRCFIPHRLQFVVYWSFSFMKCSLRYWQHSKINKQIMAVCNRSWMAAFDEIRSNILAVMYLWNDIGLQWLKYPCLILNTNWVATKIFGQVIDGIQLYKFFSLQLIIFEVKNKVNFLKLCFWKNVLCTLQPVYILYWL